MRLLRHVLALSVVALLLGPVAAQNLEADLQRAIQKEATTGNLVAAIAEYKQIAERAATSNHGVAAKALLRAAEAYERLGDAAGAQGIYARIVAEFSDQSVVATTARAKLAPPAGGSTRQLRLLWSGPHVNEAGPLSGNGRYLPFTDQDTGDLALRDLVDGSDVRVTRNSPERSWRDFAQDSAISRDATAIAYSWWIDGSRNELRLITRNPAGAAPRVLLNNLEFAYVQPFDWSPGGDWIAAQVKRQDGTAQIGIVTVSDGAFRSLKSVDWRGATRMSVSPDGGFIAYDLPATEHTSDRDIFVISRDGQRPEHRVNVRSGRNVVVGWTPDGGSLLFATERSGTMVLSAASMSKGVAQGAPQVIEPDLGTFNTSLGVTASGSLVFIKKVGGVNAFTATLDFTSGALVSAPEQVTDSVVRDHPGVMWSPDGRSMAYISFGRGTNAIVIRSLGTGETKEFSLRTNQIQFPRWTVASVITFQGADLKGRQGIFGMDVRTGETTMLVGGDRAGYRSWADASPDGRHLVYTQMRGAATPPTFAMIARDMASGQERELAAEGGVKVVSPDGRLVAYRTTSAIKVVPIEGGPATDVVKVTGLGTSFGNVLEWLPDGRRLVVGVWKDRATHRLLAVSTEGGPTVELPPAVQPLGPFFRIHSDGRRVTFSTGDPTFEVWSLENFLPAASSARR